MAVSNSITSNLEPPLKSNETSLDSPGPADSISVPFKYSFTTPVLQQFPKPSNPLPLPNRLVLMVHILSQFSQIYQLEHVEIG